MYELGRIMTGKRAGMILICEEGSDELRRIIRNYSKLEKQVEELKEENARIVSGEAGRLAACEMNKRNLKAIRASWHQSIKECEGKPKDDGKFSMEKFSNKLAKLGMTRYGEYWGDGFCYLKIEHHASNNEKFDKLWLAIRDLEEV